MSVIKRYSNRKLYDSVRRTYIKLDDIGKMIRIGEDVEVIDHDTGENITASTLAQIIYEQEKRIGGMLPRHMLIRLIRSGGSKVKSAHDSFLAFLDPFKYADNEIKRRLSLLVEQGKIAIEEDKRLCELLLDNKLRPTLKLEENFSNDELDEGISIEEMKDLLNQIEYLEYELEKLQQS